jgi:spermidine/putrescine transport system ATP-binding protein
MGQQKETVLELRAVSKRYGSHVVVEDVSLQVPAGAFFSLVGPSGCGKTTTLRMVAGLESPDSGDILLQGDVINHRRPYERNVNTVFQNYALFPHLTVFENVAFGLRRRGAAASEIARQVGEALELVGLTGKEHRLPSQISGGERQRTALVRSLVLKPDVLLLDEPLSALDPTLRKQMRTELKNLQRSVGITFLLVTHDQEEALSLSDSIAVMRQGRIEQVDSPERVYLHPRTRFVAGFVGAVNWVNGVGVRPEATRIARTPPNHGTPCVPAVVMHSLFLGNCVHVETRCNHTGERVTAELPRGEVLFTPGETVHVWWDSADEISLTADGDAEAGAADHL